MRWISSTTEHFDHCSFEKTPVDVTYCFQLLYSCSLFFAWLTTMIYPLDVLVRVSQCHLDRLITLFCLRSSKCYSLNETLGASEIWLCEASFNDIQSSVRQSSPHLSWISLETHYSWPEITYISIFLCLIPKKLVRHRFESKRRSALYRITEYPLMQASQYGRMVRFRLLQQYFMLHGRKLRSFLPQYLNF